MFRTLNFELDFPPQIWTFFMLNTNFKHVKLPLFKQGTIVIGKAHLQKKYILEKFWTKMWNYMLKYQHFFS